jgi:hypothetical protein
MTQEAGGIADLVPYFFLKEIVVKGVGPVTMLLTT